MKFDTWAEALLQEIYYAPDDINRTLILKEHLNKAYIRGKDRGWAYDLDTELSTEEDDELNLGLKRLFDSPPIWEK